ncbi:MAG: hypothetical protein RR837_12315 [Bacteroidales bacterium]
MALKYVISKSINPKDRETQHYGAKIRQIDHLPLLEMARVISDQCSVTASDVLGTYDNLLYALKQYLLKGYMVRLAHFGSMRLSIQGKSAISAEEWKAGNIRKLRVLFNPGEMLQVAYRGAEFKSAGKSASLLA